MNGEDEFERLCLLITQRQIKRRNDFKDIEFQIKDVEPYKIYKCEYCDKYIIPIYTKSYCLCDICMSKYCSRQITKRNSKRCSQI